MEFIKKNLGIFVLIIGFLGLIIYNWDKISITETDTAFDYIETTNIDTEVTSEEVITEKTNELEEETLYPENIIKIKVEIKGEVVNPGTYELYYNSRVEDLIYEAGGYTEFANTDDVEEAKVLTDGETIVVSKTETREIYVEITGNIMNPGIYTVPEGSNLEDLIYLAGGVTPNCDITKINWDTLLCLGASIYIPGYEDEIVTEEESDLININTASLDELMELPGIGEILGQRIIDYRNEHGDFERKEDIMFVSGIKDTIYEEIKESITV